MNPKMARIRRLENRAKRGEAKAIAELSRVSDEITTEVNSRLRALERRRYDYGGYNTPTNFTQTMFGTNRFAEAKDFGDDYSLMSTQAQLGVKFLSMQSSTVKGQQAIETKRFDAFIEMGLIDEDFSKRKFRNFLRFLGNEETRQVLESWSTSEVMLEAIYDAYNRKGNTKKKMLQLFQEFLDPTIKMDLPTMMRKLGVDITDYRRRRWIEY